MGDYAPNWAGRLKVQYKFNGGTSSMGFHDLRDAAQGGPALWAKARLVLLALAPSLSAGWEVTNVTYCDQDATLFAPVTFVTVQGTGGGGPVAATEYGEAFAQFGSRDSQGSRGSFYVFGGVWLPSTHGYRRAASADPDVAAALVVLNAAPPATTFGSGAGGSLAGFWKNYINIGLNRHRVRKQRA